MRLISLVVFSSISDEIFRVIKFNEKGLSLIVDETNEKTSGSNIGKTTAVKIIDLCLGAKSVSSIYKEKDTGENVIIKEFIEKNRVVAELNVRVGEESHTFTRALYKNGNNKIDGKGVKNAEEYRRELNRITFNNFSNTPSFRQLVSKFIRLDSSNEDALLKYLGTYVKNYEYQAIYSYLFGLGNTKSENVSIIARNECIDKDMEVIFRKNGISSIEEFVMQIDLMEEELEKFRRAYESVSVIEEYQERKARLEDLLFAIKELESNVERSKLNINLMKEKIRREKNKLFSVDERALRLLYDETQGVIKDLLHDFDDLKTFHNGMLEKRMEILSKSLSEKEYELLESSEKLYKMQRIYEKEYVEFGCEVKDRFEEKYSEYTRNKVKYEGALSDYTYVEKLKKEKEENLGLMKSDGENLEKCEERKNALNMYFKSFTEKIVSEPYALVFNENDDEFPITIVGLSGKPGTGIKKAMITCFDLAHIGLIIKEDYHMPKFEIHDKMENIDLVELQNIVNVAREFEGQYIFPILNDRIDSLGIKENEVVLRLSNNKKFFGI